MSHPDFLARIDATENMAWEPGKEEGTVTVVTRNGHLRVFTVEQDDLSNHDWDELARVFFGKREAKIMDHITRVCGYFAKVQNFNASKVAELHDRQRGNYALPTPT